ncbi:snRNA-activating protein complex subunit 4 [Brachyistius frenatus]|uniref:snRNA-activating protein complex subunit 4 n=1 Tax=Brachyistius frenatus TaxID=100188 RepID=UPI0037E94AF8
MSVSLSVERDRIQRQVEELEQSLSVSNAELELLSSETDDGSDGDDDEEDEESAAGLLAQRDKIQKEIQNLEDVLGPHSPLALSDDDSSSDESELGLSLSVDSCLQMNLVYQQVVQETLDQLETLLTENHRQQRELVSQLSGPIRESSREQPARSSFQQPINVYLGRFLKPYFKDKLTGLGPPANQEAKEKASRMTGCMDDRKVKMKRWESWQKTLLIHSVCRDSMKRLIQPKLSKVNYLSQKLSSAGETDRQQLREQIDSLEREINLLRAKKEAELIGDRYEEHDWQKISNIDFEGTKDAEDIRGFWQNFLHPSINKSRWSQKEAELLKDICRRHGDRRWDTIAKELGTGRTAFMCLQMFQRFVPGSLRRGSWTLEEDVLLRELVDKMRIGNFIPYTQISYFMEGRDPTQLIYRWNQVLDPSLKRGPWTKEEDQLLLRAVSHHGEKNWWKIRLEVPGRTDGGCRDRYHDCLKGGMKKGAFDKQEKELLLQLVEKHGVGRWTKIASEIPHRFDAQCLREWKKMSAPPAQKDKMRRNPAKSRGGQKKETKVSARRSIRRRLMTLKEEEESSEEEEEMAVQYMDSDDETKMEVVDRERTDEEEEEEQQQEEEEEYTFSPLQDWIPAEKSEPLSSLTFRPVLLSSSSSSHRGKPVRSTVLGRFGRSVLLGPPPRELPREEHHSCSAMLMVSPEQLRSHLDRRALRFHNRTRQNPPGRVTDTAIGFELQTAVTPWIGNLLIPARGRPTATDALRERGEGAGLSSTPVFMLLLQTMSVDVAGCKDMIEQRKKRVVLLTPPPDPSTVKKVNPKTVAGLLQRRKAMKEEQQEVQQRLLQQLQLAQQEKHKLQQATSRPPSLLLHLPPNISPQAPPSSLPPSSCSAGVAPPPPSHSLTALPVYVIHNVTPTCSQQAPPPSLNQAVSIISMPSTPSPKPSCTAPNPASGRDQKEAELQKASCRHDELKDDAASPPRCTAPIQPLAPPSSLTTPPAASPARGQRRGRKRARGEEQQQVTSSEEQAVGGASTGTGVVQEGKRVRKPSHKARALQEVTKAKADAKMKRTSSSSPEQKRTHRSHSKQEVVTQTQPLAPPPGMQLLPGQSMWVMTPAGLVQLVQAPSQGLQLVLIPSAPLPRPPRKRPLALPALQSPQPPSVSVPVHLPALTHPLPAPPTCYSKPPPSVLPFAPPPGSSPLCPLQPPSKVFLPYKDAVSVDPSEQPPLRKEGLQFDPSLMSLEPRAALCDWLSGRRGVVVPGAGVALPYLPPFVSSLSMLSALLRAKTSLTKSSLQLLSRGSKGRRPQPRPEAPPPPDQPDSTSDCRRAEGQPAPSVRSDPPEEAEQEAELVAAVRQLVAERFSGNPAHQLLKARFLSCFTVPALLATMQPFTEKPVASLANQEEEEREDEEELKKIKERGRCRRAERSSLLCDDSGAPANHFSGIIKTCGPDWNGPVETRPD